MIGTIVASILLVEPGALERTPNPQLPTLLGFDFLFWFAPVFVACVAGGFEYGVRQLLSKDRAVDPTTESSSDGRDRPSPPQTAQDLF